MKIIGITGSSGSGKSTACEELKKYLNAEIIDADKVAKELTSKTSEYLLEIVKLFGKDILNELGTLNRQALAEIIYNDYNAKEKLDKITFKFVCEKIKDEIQDLKEKQKCKYIIIDAPLLLESGLNNICDFVISIIANKEVKIHRISSRDNITSENAIKRLNIQKDDNYYISNSNFIIENNDDKENLEKQIKEIGSKINKE